MKPLNKLVPKGGDTVDLRAQKRLVKNGNSASIIIPASYLKNLKWTAGETEVYITLTEKGEVVLTAVKQVEPAKAS